MCIPDTAQVCSEPTLEPLTYRQGISLTPWQCVLVQVFCGELPVLHDRLTAFVPTKSGTYKLQGIY